MRAMRRHHRPRAALLSVAALLAATVLTPSPAHAVPAFPGTPEQLTAMVNEYRELHGVPPLKVDQKLNAQAQRWADRGKFEHSATDGYGENLAVIGAPCTRGSGPDDPWNSLRKSVTLWYEEINDYDFDHPDTVAGDKAEFDKGIGHFTQLVWKSSRKIGVGITTHPKQYWKCLIVAQFTPPGNRVGEFRENVPRPKEAAVRR